MKFRNKQASVRQCGSPAWVANVLGHYFSGRFLKAAAVAATVLVAATGHAQTQAQTQVQTLRVCADPDNLPFSSEGKEKGMYVELAELVGRKLNMPVEYTWWSTAFQRRAMRNTIQKDECDAMFALPASTDWRARGVQKSQPFLDVGYAMVTPTGNVFTSLEALKGKRIALQYSTTPHILFSTLTGYTTSTYRNADEVFKALADGQADVGFLWGPVAGYDNKARFQGRWQITPVAGLDLSGQVVVGVRAGAEGLKARIDQALTDLQPEIRSLAEKYGFPTAKPVQFDGAPLTKPSSALAVNRAQAAVQVPASGLVFVNTETPPPKPKPKPKAKAAATAATAATAVTAAAVAPEDPTVASGRLRFNDKCSHCHGANGASPLRERDVRRMQMRYDAKWQEVAQTTIRNGRPDTGMPIWKDVLNDQQLKELMAFLNTIQK